MERFVHTWGQPETSGPKAVDPAFDLRPKPQPAIPDMLRPTVPAFVRPANRMVRSSILFASDSGLALTPGPSRTAAGASRADFTVDRYVLYCLDCTGIPRLLSIRRLFSIRITARVTRSVALAAATGASASSPYATTVPVGTI